MAFRVQPSPAGMTVVLTGVDRILVWRRSVTILTSHVRSAEAAERGALEALVDHRIAGIGPHDGGGRPGRRRVGFVLGRSVVGRQFWAVDKGPPDQRLLVVADPGAPFERGRREPRAPT